MNFRSVIPLENHIIRNDHTDTPVNRQNTVHLYDESDDVMVSNG